MYHADRHEIPVEMDLIRVGGTEQLLVMVQLRDITDRKKLEHQLQSHREDLELNVRERTREIEETKQYLGKSARECQRCHLYTRSGSAVHLCQQ